MRWVALALALGLSPAASAAECSGAPKPGTDDAGNFRYLRAIVERSPAFAFLKSENKPISCDYKFSGSGSPEAVSVIRFASGSVQLVVERHFGGCVETRGAELTFTPREEGEVLSILRKDMQHYAPGSERKIAKEFLELKQYGEEVMLEYGKDVPSANLARVAGRNGKFHQFAYVTSIGCSEEEAHAKN